MGSVQQPTICSRPRCTKLAVADDALCAYHVSRANRVFVKWLAGQPAGDDDRLDAPMLGDPGDDDPDDMDDDGD